MAFALAPFSATFPSRVRQPQETYQPSRIQAVCLDIDDTLVDFTTSSRSAVADLTNREDLWPVWQRATEQHVARVVAGEMDYDTMRRARTKAFFADLGALLDDDLVCVMEERRLAQLNGTWQLFGDALPCLDWLRAAGLKIAGVTNASGAHQHTKLAELGIARFFDTVVIAGELGAAKPDPAIFHAAGAQLGLPVSELLHVGDLLDVDAIGARDAGLHGVWLDRAGCDPLAGRRFESGVHVIGSLAQLPELLVSEYRTPTMFDAPPDVPGVPTQR